MRNGEKINLNMKGKEDRKTVITSFNLWIKCIFHTNLQINVLLNSCLILELKQISSTNDTSPESSKPTTFTCSDDDSSHHVPESNTIDACDESYTGYTSSPIQVAVQSHQTYIDNTTTKESAPMPIFKCFSCECT